MKKQSTQKRIYQKPICKMVAEIPSGLVVTKRQEDRPCKDAESNEKNEKINNK